MSSSQRATYESFDADQISDEMLAQAAKFFSSHYGVWGNEAAGKMGVPSMKEGSLDLSSPFSLFRLSWHADNKDER